MSESESLSYCFLERFVVFCSLRLCTTLGPGEVGLGGLEPRSRARARSRVGGGRKGI